MTIPPATAAGRHRQRWFRPAHLVPTPAGVWLLEDVQPVAAFLDRASPSSADGPLRLVDWVGTPPAPPGSSRVAVADGDGFAVHDGEDAPVVRVASDGGIRAHPAPGLNLCAAHDGDLWLTGSATVVVPFRVRGTPSPPPLRRWARDSSSCSRRTAAAAR